MSNDPNLKFKFLPSDNFIAEYLKVFNDSFEVSGERYLTRPDITSTHLPSDFSEPISNDWVKESFAEHFTRSLGVQWRRVQQPLIKQLEHLPERPNKINIKVSDGVCFVGFMFSSFRDWFDSKVKKGNTERLMGLLAAELQEQIKNASGKVLWLEIKHLCSDKVMKLNLISRNDGGVDLEVECLDYDFGKLLGPDGKPRPPQPPCKLLEPPK